MDVEEITAEALERGAAQKYEELLGLVKLIHQQQPRVVVEIGTLRGGTLGAWCRCAHPKATVISVDLPDGPWGGGYTDGDVDRLRSYAQPGQELHLIQGDSHDIRVFSRVYELIGERRVDFLFIDGDHSYQGVRDDFDDYSPLVDFYGIVAFHDILPHPQVPGCDVDRFWSELSPRYPERWEFCQPDNVHHAYGQWGGIGAIRL